jgi:hypothetical protein
MTSNDSDGEGQSVPWYKVRGAQHLLAGNLAGGPITVKHNGREVEVFDIRPEATDGFVARLVDETP